MTIRDSCSRCSRDYDLQRCSKCQSVWYCSSKCELAASKSHKPKCQILDGSDSPPSSLPPEESKPSTSTLAAASGDKTTLSSALRNSDVILGVKIVPDGDSPNASSRSSLHPRFVDERFAPTDDIFANGELCPVTELYGIPILILFESTIYTCGNKNYPALDLCFGAYDGRGHPENWSPLSLHNYTGTAFVVRRDRKPLIKETVETMYHFHVSLNLGDSFRDKDGVHHLPNGLTPTDFREFSERYWTEEATKLEQGRYRHPFMHRVFTGLIKRK